MNATERLAECLIQNTRGDRDKAKRLAEEFMRELREEMRAIAESAARDECDRRADPFNE